MKKAAYDNGGNILGFYDTAINQSIPAQSLTLTNEQYLDCISNQGKYTVNTVTPALVLNTGYALAQAKRLKRAEIDQANLADLHDTFTSSALGSPHTYANTPNAQLDLISLIVAGATANYAYLSSGNPVMASHTLAELQQVLTDLLSNKQSSLSNYATKVASINSAATVNDVNAITY